MAFGEETFRTSPSSLPPSFLLPSSLPSSFPPSLPPSFLPHLLGACWAMAAQPCSPGANIPKRKANNGQVHDDR